MNPLSDKINVEIQQQGAIPFCRFMELALYCPVFGYYEKEGDTPGRSGDYITSVSVGTLFGELLAWQFAEWLQFESRFPSSPHPPRSTLRVCEAGAHRGDLARDILQWLRANRPAIYRGLEYWIVDPSEHRRAWQRQTLHEFDESVRWANNLAEVGPMRGIIFSNELLDAMPVHRLGWDAEARRWFEWGVTCTGGQFTWTRLPLRVIPAAALSEVPAELGAVLPDGFTLEVSVLAREWWGQAAKLLESGKLLTIDYGFSSEEKWAPERLEGTLRAYRHHQVSGDLLADPGLQDLTSHVDFGALERIGESLGLRTELFATQSQFLTGIAARIWESQAAVGSWSAQQRRQFQSLTHPDHLGRAFRVLVQARDVLPV